MSWKKVLIPDVLFFQEGPGVRNTQFTSSGVKLLNVGNINNGLLDLDATKIYISEKEAFGKYGHFLVEAGDLLIASSGIVVDNFHNKITWAKAEDLPLCMNTSTIRFKSLDSGVLDIRYFSYFLKTRFFSDQLRKLITGSAQLNFGSSHLKQISLPLPPLPIQKRIAEILDAADALRRKDQELVRKYDELAQAIFIDMFGDPVKNEKGFAKIKLGECLDNIQIGPFGTQLHESDYIKNGIPLINPMHIGDLKIKPNYNYSISEEKYLELPQYHLKVDDVILGRRGEMGRCAIVTKEQGKCLCGTGSLFLTVKKELLDPLFLVYVLSRKTTKIALENVSAGTTMANLNKNIISDFEIILPNIAKQKDFVNAIKMSEKSIEFTNELVNKSNHIFDSLLQQAFKGELVK